MRLIAVWTLAAWAALNIVLSSQARGRPQVAGVFAGSGLLLAVGLLLGNPARDPGGRRVYSAFDIDQLRLVTGLRAVGIPIEAIRKVIAAKELGADPRANAQRALQQLTEIDALLQARQAELRAASRLIRGWRAEIDQWLRGQPTR